MRDTEKQKQYISFQVKKFTMQEVSILLEDALIVELPLEIRLTHGPINNRQRSLFSTTMRTPGNDKALSVGLLVSEKIIQQRDDILETIQDGEHEFRVVLHPCVEYDPEKNRRTGFSNSSCGMCGKHLIQQQLESSDKIRKMHLWQKSRIFQLLNANSITELFNMTGGVHFAKLIDENLQLLHMAEDVGRHNAVDKVLGEQWLQNSNLGAASGDEQNSKKLMFVSSRASFEIVQKAAVAKIPVVVTIGAATSLAVQFAEVAGITLIGFARDHRFNVYTHADRMTE